MIMPLAEALAQVDLEAGRVYRCEVKGRNVEVRVLEEVPAAILSAPLVEADIARGFGRSYGSERPVFLGVRSGLIGAIRQCLGFRSGSRAVLESGSRIASPNETCWWLRLTERGGKQHEMLARRKVGAFFVEVKRTRHLTLVVVTRLWSK